jgi:uncharacterized protein (UPF0548 family)
VAGFEDVEALAGRPFNYAEVGATAARLPAGYEQVRRSRVIGHGAPVFSDAAAALFRWDLHRRSGLSVAAGTDAVLPGTDVLLGFGIGAVRLPIPCRVVYVIEEATRRGFAYGTLTGHPESGEELFVVAQGADGEVTIQITAFSRPALWWSRLGSPAGRALQAAVTRRYLAALA